MNMARFFRNIRHRLNTRAGALCLAGMAAFAVLFLPVLAPAAQEDTHVERSGELPRQGRAIIRSGMAWLDESSPVFHRVSEALAKELTARGLTIVPVRPSALEPMPKTPLPNKQAAQDVPARRAPKPEQGASEGVASQKAADLGKTGQLPKLKLRTYGTPDKDADLPESVRNITAPDVTRALYARSQQTGKPVVHSFSVPGRVPKELTDDAKIADYAFIVRLAAVQAWAEAPNPFPFGPGVLVAASSIGGTGALGYGPPAQPGQSTYGTPGGYVRGYEGSAPNDFWGRDRDFFQRDYMFKHGPQPNYATPPSGLSNSRTGTPQPGFGVGPLRGREHVSNIGWHLLILDCFDLAPARDGKRPVRVWQAAIRSPGDPDALATGLPKMIPAIFAAKQQ